MSMLREVAFCTTCRNRTSYLQQTLPRNLANNSDAKFVILNYNTRDNLLGYLTSAYPAELESGRLACYSYFDHSKFRMAHAKNMAHRAALLEGADLLVNLDADNFTGVGFDHFVADCFGQRDDMFLWARMIPGELTRGISGRIALSKNGLLRCGGYDEVKFVGWGSDDKDINLRLRQLGCEAQEIDPIFLDGVPHNNKIRFKEYPHLAQLDDEAFAVNPSTITQSVVNEGAIGCGVVYRNDDFNSPVYLQPFPTRVFGIGMHKTATTSLHRAWQTLGYESWHWSSAHAAKAIFREINGFGRSATVEQYYALCDLPIPLLFKQLDKAYPGSKFILTLRDEGPWLKAVRRHFSPAHNKWCTGWDNDPFTHRVHRLLYGRADFDPEVMLERYRRHNTEVLEYFRHRPRDLLVMNMDQGAGWKELCPFLGRPIPDAAYPLENFSGEPQKQEP